MCGYLWAPIPEVRVSIMVLGSRLICSLMAATTLSVSIFFTEPFTVHRDLGPLFPRELSPDASLPDTSLVGIGRNRPGALLGEDDAVFVDRPV